MDDFFRVRLVSERETHIGATSLVACSSFSAKTTPEKSKLLHKKNTNETIVIAAVFFAF